MWRCRWVLCTSLVLFLLTSLVVATFSICFLLSNSTSPLCIVAILSAFSISLFCGYFWKKNFHVSGATAHGIVLLGGGVTVGLHLLVHGVSAGRLHPLVQGATAGRRRHHLPGAGAGAIAGPQGSSPNAMNPHTAMMPEILSCSKMLGKC